MTLTRQDALARLLAVESELGELQSQFATEPALYEIYRQPLSYERGLLREQLRADLAADDTRAELWISLRGSAFGSGSGSTEVLAHFLTNFRIAAKHTVSALRGITHTGGRFLREVEAATDFQFVAVAPGSLRIGLARPKVDQLASVPDADLFADDLVAQAISDAVERSTLGLRAVKTLLRALEAPDDPQALEELRSELSDHGTLRVLHHAQSLFPRGVEGVEFSGRVLDQPRQFRSDVKERLRSLGEKLVQAERYVSGIGIIRMLDLDRGNLRIEFARIESLPELDTVSAEYDPNALGSIAELMDQPVSFAGWLRFDTRGNPQKVQVDSVDPLEAVS
ncbi:MAG: hypothetical protein WKG32_11720 [Gemmatimonadaceae bacterium]